MLLHLQKYFIFSPIKHNSIFISYIKKNFLIYDINIFMLAGGKYETFLFRNLLYEKTQLLDCKYQQKRFLSFSQRHVMRRTQF